MRIIPLFLLLSSTITFADTCKEFFRDRGQNAQKTEQAISCYQADIKNADNDLDKANILSQLSYLYFFKAEMFLDKKLSALDSSMKYAKQGALLFGELYDIEAYRALDQASKITLAKNLYNYGTAVARYVDIKGKWEAIKRMGDIKNSMNAILRIRQADIAFYGAHRTLAIFHMKVPAIAGGKKALSKKYFKIIIEKTSYRGDISRYPVNNLMYADYYYSENMMPAACRQLDLIKDLSVDEITKMANGLFSETLKDVKEAGRVFKEYKCDTISFTL